MEIFKNKFLVKLIATICLFLTLLNFSGSSKVYAKGDDEVWGGVLLNPVIQLLVSIGDTVMEILHESVQSQSLTIIQIDGSQDWWEKVKGVLIVALAIVAAVAFIAVIVSASGFLAAAGAAAASLGKAGMIGAFVHAAASTAGSAIVGGSVVGIVTGVALKRAAIPEDIHLPAFSITAEQIFRNELALFDVNFFNPGYYSTKVSTTVDITTPTSNVIYNGNTQNTYFMLGAYCRERGTGTREVSSLLTENDEDSDSIVVKRLIEEINGQITDETKKITSDMQVFIYETKTSLDTVDTGILGETQITAQDIHTLSIVDDEMGEYIYIRYIYTEKYNRQQINDPNLPVQNIDSGHEYKESVSWDWTNGGDGIIYKTEEKQLISTAAQLQGIVSTWYFILRNTALLVLMLLLIYSGIRIVLGSTAGEKAKYKERLMDWLVAICLIFVMHYIMVFAVEIVGKITKLVGKTINSNMAYIQLTETQYTDAKNKLDGYDTTGNGTPFVEENGGTSLVWPTDLAGLFRIKSQLTDIGTTAWAGYSLCYVVLVLFTLFFAFTYARRVLYMAFLTIIAPLVAMTYPIDKITDGKAQAFDSWLKEYIFNLMIQPLHLLLYNILVSSAFVLASESPIYALVALGFMMPAEKLMRKFFGFEKAKTPGLLGGAAGAAFVWSGMQSLMRKSPKSSNNSGGTNNKEKDEYINKKYSSSGGPNMSTLAGVDEDGNGGNSIINTASNEAGNSAQPAGRTSTIKGFGQPKEDEGDANNSNNSASAQGSHADQQQGQTGENQQNRNVPYIDPSFFNGDLGLYQQALQQHEFQEEEKRKIAARKRQEEAQRRAAERAAQNTFRARAGRIIKGVNKEFRKQAGQRFYAKTINGQPMRKLLKTIGGAYTGALLGTSGVILAATSGEANKIVPYGAAGAMGGYKLGSATVDAVAGTAGVDDLNSMQREVELSYYGEDYSKVKYEQTVENELKSAKNVGYLRETYNWSEEEATDFLDDFGRQCFDWGIRDIEEISAINEVVQTAETEPEREQLLKEAVAATKMKKSMPGKVKDMRDNKLDEWKATYNKAFAQKIAKATGKSVDDQEVKDRAAERTNYTIKLMKSLEDAQSNLSKL